MTLARKQQLCQHTRSLLHKQRFFLHWQKRADKTKSMQSHLCRSCESARSLASAFWLQGGARWSPAQSHSQMTQGDCVPLYYHYTTLWTSG